MNYEKKYKEAIERLKQWDKEHPLGYSIQERDEFIFPELAESDDERIRNAIIRYFRHGTSYTSFYGFSKEQVISWLEKQGEQKPAEWGEEDEEMLENAISSINHESVMKGLRTRGISCGIDASAHLMKNLIDWLKNLKDRVQPQPKNEWSEEDEKHLSWLIEHLNQSGELYSNLIDWLKSLRPQNRCTYNPYKEVVESIAEMCEKYEDANLDSLKDFYSNVKVKCKDAKEYDSLFPQSTWKPSDEQLDSLYDVLNPCDGFNREVLESLYVQLKKLREG